MFSTLLRGDGWTEAMVGVEGVEGTVFIAVDEPASGWGTSETLDRDFIRRM